METDKTCPQCERRLPSAAFHKDRRTPTGLRCYCKECTKSRFQTQFRTSENYAARLAKYKEKRSQERASNPIKVWVNDAYHNAKGRAKAAGLAFTITKDDIKNLFGERCPLLNTEFVFGAGTTQPQSPSLDRRRPEDGYTPENCWVISAKANRIKSDATPSEVMQVAQALCRLAKEGYY